MPVEQIAGQYQATPQAFADGQTIAVQVDEQGNLKIAGSSGMTPIQTGGPLYERVPESQTAVPLGTGAVGDTLTRAVLIPKTLNPGAVTIIDGSDSGMIIFTGGTASVSTLHSFVVELGIKSVTGGWTVTTGANIDVMFVGNWTP